MGVREWLIKKLSATLVNIPQSTITKVVQHNYESIHSAFKENDSIEIAGFGKFYFNRKKAMDVLNAYEKQIEEHREILKDTSLKESSRQKSLLRIDALEKNIEWLNNKQIDNEAI